MPRIVVVLAALTLVHDPVSAADSAWSQWRGPGRDGHSAETGINTDWTGNQPKLLWQVEGLGAGYSSVSIADGRIFTTGNVSDGQAVIARKLSDGSPVWSTTLTDKVPKHGKGGARCTPSIDGAHVYVILSEGTVACLKAADGAVVWKKNCGKDFGGRMMTGWGFSESPLVDGDRVIVTPGGKDAGLVALDKMTGKEIWRSAIPAGGKRGKDGAGYSSVVISNACGVKQYVQLMGRGVVSVRADNGKFLWQYNRVANGVANISTPVVSGDYVFCSTGYGTGSALVKLEASGDTGVSAEEVYFLDSKTLQNHHGGMVLVGDHIYCGHQHNAGFPICVEMKTGKVIWGGKIRGPGSGSAAVMYIDGHLIFRYQNGVVALIEASPNGYKLKGSFKPAYQKGSTWAHPVVLDGKLYLREQNQLMCYEVK
jgi:outer membrane protein assembly factor BamB